MNKKRGQERVKPKRYCRICDELILGPNYFFCYSCHNKVGDNDQWVHKYRDLSPGAGCRKRDANGAWVPVHGSWTEKQ